MSESEKKDAGLAEAASVGVGDLVSTFVFETKKLDLAFDVFLTDWWERGSLDSQFLWFLRGIYRRLEEMCQPPIVDRDEDWYPHNLSAEKLLKGLYYLHPLRLADTMNLEILRQAAEYRVVGREEVLPPFRRGDWVIVGNKRYLSHSGLGVTQPIPKSPEGGALQVGCCVFRGSGGTPWRVYFHGMPVVGANGDVLPLWDARAFEKVDERESFRGHEIYTHIGVEFVQSNRRRG